MLQNTSIYKVLVTLAPQKHTKRPILATFGPTMSDTSQFGVQIMLAISEAWWSQKRQEQTYYVKQTPLPCHKIPRILGAKAKKAPIQ